MRIKFLLCVCAGTLLLAGCTTTNELSAAGQSVKFSEDRPASNCQALGTVVGTQSNWLSGQGGEGSSMRGAANDLRNKAAAMGGNVIYGTASPVGFTETYLSSFAPLDSKIQGQVYKCP